jgi:hypothetical protein
VLLFLVPQTRKSAFEVLGVTAIAAVALAAIGLPVWGLYHAEPLLKTPQPVVAADDGTGQLDALLRQQQEDERRRLDDERRLQAEEQRKREEEMARVAGIADTLRSIVERERRYAGFAASSPRLPGTEGISVDLIGIRIPAWRDAETAEREKEVILAWLYSLGLTAEEAASIHTANGWGSVYDIWRAEHADAGDPGQGMPVEVVSVEEEAAAAEQEPESEPEPEPVPELPPAPELRLEEAERQALLEQRAAARRAEARRPAPPPRRPPPVRRPPPEREIGPFGY